MAHGGFRGVPGCVDWFDGGLLFGYATLGQVHSLVSRGKKVTLNHGSTSISVGGRGRLQGAAENGCGEPDGTGLPDGGEEDLDPC